MILYMSIIHSKIAWKSPLPLHNEAGWVTKPDAGTSLSIYQPFLSLSGCRLARSMTTFPNVEMVWKPEAIKFLKMATGVLSRFEWRRQPPNDPLSRSSLTAWLSNSAKYSSCDSHSRGISKESGLASPPSEAWPWASSAFAWTLGWSTSPMQITSHFSSSAGKRVLMLC